MVAADTMEGADSVRVPRLPHAEVQAILRRYERSTEKFAPPAGD
jgi:hypothetical protein